MISPVRRRTPVRPIAVLVAAASLAAGGAASCSGNGSDDGVSGAPTTASEAGAPGDDVPPSTGFAPQPEPTGETVIVDRFDRPDGVVTDERTWHDDTGTVPPDDTIWAATCGVLRVQDGEGWSDSPVFRMVTHRRDLGDVAVAFRLRIDELAGDGGHPEEAWDGVHVLLHYQDETELYAVSVSRRDGEVAIKRKDPGGPSNGGTYSTLASGPGAVPVGGWSDVRVTIRRTASGVAISVALEGTTVLEATDADAVGARESRPGRVGVRADNTTFRIDDLTVQRLDPASG